MEGHDIPKYVIFADPGNPDIAALEWARLKSMCVSFAVFIAGAPFPQILSLVPTEVRHSPSSNFCLIKGSICGPDGPTDRLIEGMFHLASRGYGGFDDM